LTRIAAVKNRAMKVAQCLQWRWGEEKGATCPNEFRYRYSNNHE
jgi:hypothetical protein